MMTTITPSSLKKNERDLNAVYNQFIKKGYTGEDLCVLWNEKQQITNITHQTFFDLIVPSNLLGHEVYADFKGTIRDLEKELTKEFWPQQLLDLSEEFFRQSKFATGSSPPDSIRHQTECELVALIAFRAVKKIKDDQLLQHQIDQLHRIENAEGLQDRKRTWTNALYNRFITIPKQQQQQQQQQQEKLKLKEIQLRRNIEFEMQEMMNQIARHQFVAHMIVQRKEFFAAEMQEMMNQITRHQFVAHMIVQRKEFFAAEMQEMMNQITRHQFVAHMVVQRKEFFAAEMQEMMNQIHPFTHVISQVRELLKFVNSTTQKPQFRERFVSLARQIREKWTASRLFDVADGILYILPEIKDILFLLAMWIVVRAVSPTENFQEKKKSLLKCFAAIIEVLEGKTTFLETLVNYDIDDNNIGSSETARFLLDATINDEERQILKKLCNFKQVLDFNLKVGVIALENTSTSGLLPKIREVCSPHGIDAVVVTEVCGTLADEMEEDAGTQRADARYVKPKGDEFESTTNQSGHRKPSGNHSTFVVIVDPKKYRKSDSGVLRPEPFDPYTKSQNETCRVQIGMPWMTLKGIPSLRDGLGNVFDLSPKLFGVKTAGVSTLKAADSLDHHKKTTRAAVNKTPNNGCSVMLGDTNFNLLRDNMEEFKKYLDKKGCSCVRGVGALKCFFLSSFGITNIQNVEGFGYDMKLKLVPVKDEFEGIPLTSVIKTNHSEIAVVELRNEVFSIQESRDE